MNNISNIKKLLGIAILSGVVACILEETEMEADTTLPIMENQSFSIGNDATNGQIIDTVRAIAADSYHITAGNTGNVFNLNDSSGLLSVASASALSVPEYTLNVLVSNIGSGYTASATVTVRVTNSGGSEPNTDDYQPPHTKWRLSWSDEFNGSAIDSSTWTHELGQHGWGNSELQNYTSSRENSYTSNGRLVIESKYTGGPATEVGNYTSARLISENKFSFKYGLIVVRMKAPYGRGVWPAIWMLGGQDDTDAGWPYDWPQCGEIDIFEMFGGQGNDDETSYSRTTGAMHWLGTRNCNGEAGGEGHQYCAGGKTHTERLANDFHYYSLEWNEDCLIWRFDGEIFQARDITSSELDEFRATNFFLLLNIAVGGNPVPDPDTSVFPQKMEIDWIRVYTNSGPPTVLTNKEKAGGDPERTEGDVLQGSGWLFTDASSSSNVGQIALSGGILKDSANGEATFVLDTSNSGGAGGSSEYLTFSENGSNEAGSWAAFFWTFAEAYNMEAVSNTSFSFYVRSSQLGSIKVKLEDVNGGGMAASDEVEKTFTADGRWQQVTFSASEFSAPDLTKIKKAVIVVPVGATDAVLTMDFDEVQFITNAGMSPSITPTIAAQSFSLGSDATNGQVIGLVEASNADSYRITAGNSGNVFNLDDSNGTLWVATATALSVGDVNLTVEVSNASSGYTASAVVTVMVTNSAAPPMATIAAQSFSLGSDATNGQVIGTGRGEQCRQLSHHSWQ